jgi:hypothetical protein
LCGKKLISNNPLIILAFISPKPCIKLLCAYINLVSLPFLKIIKFKISNIVGKIYAIKLNVTISQVFSIIANTILIIIEIGRKLLLKLSNILNLERSPKRVLFFCFIFSFYFIFKP